MLQNTKNYTILLNVKQNKHSDKVKHKKSKCYLKILYKVSKKYKPKQQFGALVRFDFISFF